MRLAGLFCLLCLSFPSHAASKPNVILIFADDLGYADLGCFGSTTIATPRLDQMAKEGIRLTDFHTDSPVCTPSRAALLTGTHAARIGLANHVLFPKSKIGLSSSEVTIARSLKSVGYATICIGKWHLGDSGDFLPTAHGFDAYFGIPYSNDMRVKIGDKVGPPLMRNSEIIEHPTNQASLTPRYTSEAINFITANKDKPFFLYLPHTFPHVPLFTEAPFKDKSKGGLYGDVVETLDWSVGQILDTLKKLNIDDNTLVIFTSDNGPWLIKKDHGGSAKPLRDGKGTIYEGGHRVAFIARWPGKIPAGASNNQLAGTIDIFPTLAKLIEAPFPTDRVIDGRDIWPLLTNQPGAKTPHDLFFHHTSQGPLGAVRSGPWKLHLPRKQQQKELPAELYNLEKDLSETTNVAAENPDVVKRLTDAAEAYKVELAKNARPVGRHADDTAPGKPEKGAND